LSDRLLLGFSGWPLVWPDYFPEDLPEDWRLAYYSNDADALVLSADELHAIDVDDLEEWCDDLPDYFRFYLKVDAVADVSAGYLEVIGEHLGAFLLPESASKADHDRSWVTMADGCWGESGQPRLVFLNYEQTDLRSMRELLQKLPKELEALILNREISDPRSLAELKTLTQLLGVA
jgi:hypothetical protein